MTKFRYTGDEYTEVFGLKWRPGDVHDVDANTHAHAKLMHNNLFEQVGGGGEKRKAPEPGPYAPPPKADDSGPIRRVSDTYEENDMDPPDGSPDLPQIRRRGRRGGEA